MSFLHVARPSACRTCLRRRLTTTSATGVTQQTRTNTKMVGKATTLTVRLREDIPKVGRKGTQSRRTRRGLQNGGAGVGRGQADGRGIAGSIVAVARGRMRNELHPKGLAEYIPAAMLKKIPAEELNPLPDLTFRPELEEPAMKSAELNLLKPSHTVPLLESFLPPTIQFTRPTTSPNEATIHGSISTTDICSAVRAIAAASGEEGSRVVVTPSMVSFLDPAVEGDKVKTLGEHKFEIRFKGAAQPILRTVVITQQISLE